MAKGAVAKPTSEWSGSVGVATGGKLRPQQQQQVKAEEGSPALASLSAEEADEILQSQQRGFKSLALSELQAKMDKWTNGEKIQGLFLKTDRLNMVLPTVKKSAGIGGAGRGIGDLQEPDAEFEMDWGDYDQVADLPTHG